ncbi:MAG: hypothetical protein JXA89_09600, partial [Anaerolineae bacterium]|nr:hypothetical protein [Anaerolineae bacterium]
MKIRSITIFANVTPNLDMDLLARLGTFARSARQRYEKDGFEVQTTRLAMDIFPALTGSEWAKKP